MAYWDIRQGCIATSETVMAAVLISRSNYWGSTPACRKAGYDAGPSFKPGTLQAVERQVSQRTLKARVIFIIAGNVDELRHRRRLFHQGELYVNAQDYSRNYRQLVDIVKEQLAKWEEKKRLAGIEPQAQGLVKLGP